MPPVEFDGDSITLFCTSACVNTVEEYTVTILSAIVAFIGLRALYALSPEYLATIYTFCSLPSLSVGRVFVVIEA